MLPVYGLFRTKGRFTDLFVWWESRVTGQVNAFPQKCIGSTEQGTYIISAAYILHHGNDRHFLRSPEFLDGLTVQLVHGELAAGNILLIHGAKVRGQ